MAVPTQDELLTFVNTYMDKQEGHLWDRADVVDAARVTFRSTTPAINLRFHELVNTGKVRRVLVDYSGLIFWRNEEGKLPNCFLVEPDGKPSYQRLTHGPVVLSGERKKYTNLWTSGTSYFYISVSGYNTLVAKLGSVAEKKEQDSLREHRASMARRKKSVQEIAPDGIDLLLRLRNAATSEHLSRVELREFERREIDGGENLYGVSIDLYGESDLTFLFDILRRGLKSLDDESNAS